MNEALRQSEEARLRRLEINAGHMEKGVSIPDTYNVYIDPQARIGAGAVIHPNTTINGASVIGEGCEIGPNTIITDCQIGDRTTVLMSVAKEASIGRDSTVGPFAYLRPNTRLGDHVKVGDFVEIKNSIIGDGTKISHLTYVGDSDVGKNVNFGCGTVTVNYDGFDKNRTIVEDNAFIGCNTNLVAPVTVHADSYTAAGSTITGDVPEGALAVARAKQTNIEGWVAKKRAKAQKHE